jgi:hypothetical protein
MQVVGMLAIRYNIILEIEEDEVRSILKKQEKEEERRDSIQVSINFLCNLRTILFTILLFSIRRIACESTTLCV